MRAVELKIGALDIAAAGTTAIAGILHLVMAPNSLGGNVNTGILFLVGGIVQVFWAVPMIKRWAMPWYAVGIAGTAVLVLIWVITRLPENPITGRAGRIGEMAIAVEALQIAYIAIAAVIIAINRRKQARQKIA